MRKHNLILFLLIVFAFVNPLIVLSQCNLTINVALGQPAVASSLENAGFPASNAFDGDGTTRWSSAFSDPQFIYVDLGTVLPLCQVVLLWENAYGADFTIDISNDALSWTTVATITGNTLTTNTISISGSGRYVRMNGTARGTGFGYSLYEFQVYSTNTPPVCPPTNIALNQPAVASSLESAAFPASNAFDGDGTTRWSSAFSDPQFIYVDLGTFYTFCNVSLHWETAYATDFTIDASDDAVTWTNLTTVTGNTVQNNSLAVSGSGRYVRMNGTARATAFGYSLWEFTVSGSIILPVTLTDFTATDESEKTVLLQWKTQQEHNNKSFEIQRSSNGLAFTKIGEVAGHINSSVVASYEFNDMQPFNGNNFYRLKQVDLDGKFVFSKIILLTLNRKDPSRFRIYPDPVIDQMTIENNSGELINNIQIYSLSGTLLKTYQGIFQQQQSLDLLSLSPGMYLIKIQTTKSQEVFRIIKE
jgi:hypothetical protein